MSLVHWRDVVLTDGEGDLSLNDDGSVRYVVDGKRPLRLDPAEWLTAMREFHASNTIAGHWACSTADLPDDAFEHGTDAGLSKADVDWTGFVDARRWTGPDALDRAAAELAYLETRWR